MARTRAGLSGRPTCRPGVICPGLSAPQGWPLAAMPAGLPVGTLRPCLTSAVDQPRAASAALRSLLSGQRPAGVAFLSWLLVFMALVPHWCRFPAVVVVPPCAACRASTKSHGRRPSIYREGEPTEGWGNPEGVPRPQAANGVSFCAGGRVTNRPKSFKDLNMYSSFRAGKGQKTYIDQ